MTDNVLASLCSAVVEQAVEDYRELSRKGIEYFGSDAMGTYSKFEIEQFFKSKWGDLMLRGMGSSIDGFTIIRQLKAEN